MKFWVFVGTEPLISLTLRAYWKPLNMAV